MKESDFWRRGMIALRRPRFAAQRLLQRLAGPAENVQIASSHDIDWNKVSDAARLIERDNRFASLHLHRAIALLQPDNAHAHYRLGLGLRLNMMDGEALQHFEQAVRLDPEFEPFRTSLIGLVFEEMGPEDGLALVDGLPPAMNPGPGIKRALLLQLMRLKRIDLALERAGDEFGAACLSITSRDDGPGKYSVRLEFAPGGYHAVFGPEFLYWPFLIERMLALRPYLEQFVREAAPCGAVQLTLGDAPDGDGVQLCFSGHAPHHRLIPDAIFLQSQGYARFKEHAATAAPWTERTDQLYWRGSLTGVAETYDEIFALPRIKLVEAGQADPRINARITDLSQFGPLLPTLEIMCDERGLLGPREDEHENLRYRYLMDVDGNTNSWPGLYTKLASGSSVIKLRSKWRQWYYDRLEDGVNVSFIDSLQPDLGELLDRLSRDPARAQRIAAASVALAGSITPQSEFSCFKATVQDALGTA